MVSEVRPSAVIISDVHYSLQTLAVADTAMRQAVTKANELEVPLVVAGDLHDTKANMRAECINAMLETFKLARTAVFILRGNHDAINEKSEAHALNFLAKEPEFHSDFDGETELPGIYIIDKPQFTNDFTINGMSVHLIPYQHDTDRLLAYLKTVDPGSCIILHQGVHDSYSGEYIQDKTALPKESFADFRCISGHYHQRQTIKCRPLPRCIAGSFEAIRNEHSLHAAGVGTFDYIGNPFTLNFAEVNDPPKGFQILMSNGLLEHVPTNLRQHRVFQFDISAIPNLADKVADNDIIWLKIAGPNDELAKLSKSTIATATGLNQSFRLDLIPTDTKSEIDAKTENLPQKDLLDMMIEDLSNTTSERKERLKTMWKDFVTKE